MTAQASALRTQLTKEIRGLSLALMGSLVAIGTSAVWPDWFRWMGFGGYFFGSSALGALSIGHEYSHRTLAAMLSQPVSRKRVLFVKLAVLAGMQLVLCTVAGWLLFDMFRFDGSTRHFGSEAPLAFMAAAVCGLFVAPYLTMVCRSPIAGAVFAMSMPGMLLLAGMLLGGWMYGFDTAAAERVMITFLWWTIPALGAAGASMTWRTFMRLQAIEGGGASIAFRWPRRSDANVTAPPRRTSHPIWQLVRKEIHLHTMPLGASVCWVFAWLLSVLLRSTYPHIVDVFHVLTVFFSGFLALLVGSLASAEERQFGTLEWQMLVPVSSRAQWAIKTAVANGLALLLGIVLPSVLVYFTPSGKIGLPAGFLVRPQAVLSIMTLANVGLYVSSVNTSGLRALLMSLPALFGAGLFFRFLIRPFGRGPADVLARLVDLPVPLDSPAMRVDMRVVSGLAPALAVALLCVVLAFGFANHRSADRHARVWSQVLWMAASVTAAVAVVAGLAS